MKVQDLLMNAKLVQNITKSMLFFFQKIKLKNCENYKKIIDFWLKLESLVKNRDPKNTHLNINLFRLSTRLEVECRILFPLTFLGFCICYWIYYCHIMDESDTVMDGVLLYEIHESDATE